MNMKLMTSTIEGVVIKYQALEPTIYCFRFRWSTKIRKLVICGKYTFKFFSMSLHVELIPFHAETTWNIIIICIIWYSFNNVSATPNQITCVMFATSNSCFNHQEDPDKTTSTGQQYFGLSISPRKYHSLASQRRKHNDLKSIWLEKDSGSFMTSIVKPGNTVAPCCLKRQQRCFCYKIQKKNRCLPLLWSPLHC